MPHDTIAPLKRPAMGIGEDFRVECDKHHIAKRRPFTRCGTAFELIQELNRGLLHGTTVLGNSYLRFRMATDDERDEVARAGRLNNEVHDMAFDLETTP